MISKSKLVLQTETNLNINQSKINKEKIDFTILNQILKVPKMSFLVTFKWHFYFFVKNHRKLIISKYICFRALSRSESVRQQFVYSVALLCMHLFSLLMEHKFTYLATSKLPFQILGLSVHLVILACQLVYSLFLISTCSEFIFYIGLFCCFYCYYYCCYYCYQ